jgi:hypothetical protein
MKPSYSVVVSSATICLCIPLTFKTPFSKWRRRRKSAKEFHAHDEELRQEYARLKQIESQVRGDAHVEGWGGGQEQGQSGGDHDGCFGDDEQAARANLFERDEEYPVGRDRRRSS